MSARKFRPCRSWVTTSCRAYLTTGLPVIGRFTSVEKPAGMFAQLGESFLAQTEKKGVAVPQEPLTSKFRFVQKKDNNQNTKRNKWLAGWLTIHKAKEVEPGVYRLDKKAQIAAQSIRDWDVVRA